MEQPAFDKLHAECKDTLQRWISEATRTCEMLGQCANSPVPLSKRSELQEQRSRENEAQAIHMATRQQLFDFARNGFVGSDLIYAKLPD